MRTGHPRIHGLAGRRGSGSGEQNVTSGTKGSNESGVPARMLILFAPGPPREEYFSELAEIRSAGRRLTDEEWIEVWARHDQYPA
jgi:hypothetical protein